MNHDVYFKLKTYEYITEDANLADHIYSIGPGITVPLR